MRQLFWLPLLFTALCADTNGSNATNTTDTNITDTTARGNTTEGSRDTTASSRGETKVLETNTNKADLVMVIKSQRKLYLSNNGNILKTYTISLGGNPKGHKQQEGDRKTPEGLYRLDYFKKDSSFYRALHVSYPNATDRARAQAAGVSPGGLIMLHGEPNKEGWWKRMFRRNDWTAGCIALKDKEMDEVLQLVKVGTPILIKP